MGNAADLRPVLDFLVQLERNNQRDWFEQNRTLYDTARAQFADLVDALIVEFRPIEDFGNITAKDCMMRIYRDVRFSKDKSPYRTNFGASFAFGGRKSSRMPYYLHIAPQGESFIAGGLYMPSSAQLARFREIIDRNPKPFKALINKRSFKQWFGELSGERLKTAPQGYDRTHPEIELLRLKNVIVMHPLSDEEVLADPLPDQIIEAFTAMKPFLDYLNEQLAGIE